MYKARQSLRGFSLVEMAVVLVAIGLVVAGVFAARSLMDRADQASVVEDARSVAEAILEFRKTFNALPGDMRNASSYFAGVNNGDGDGQIESAAGNREDLFMWQHLKASGLIKREFLQTNLTPGEAVLAGTKEGTGYVAAQDADVGVFVALSGMAPAGAPAVTDAALTALFTPTAFYQIRAYPALSGKEARDMDLRMDDGNPATGFVRAQPGLEHDGAAWQLGVCDYASLDDAAACVMVMMAENMPQKAARAAQVACGTVGETRISAARTCGTGFSGNFVETCNEDGNWEVSGNTCSSIDCAGGTFGQTRRRSCGSGFTAASTITEICRESGEWRATAWTCDAATNDPCSVAGQIRFKSCPVGQTGSITETCNGVTFDVTSNDCADVVCAPAGSKGDAQSGSCPAGFTGNTVETCAVNGSWISSTINCTPDTTVVCPTVGATRTIACPTGTVGPNGNTNAITQECRVVSGNNYWFTTSNQCKIVKCGDYFPGQSRQANAQCPNNLPGVVMEVCQSNGQWLVDNGNCVVPKCSAETGAGNAVWAATNAGTTATASSCISGYVPNGALPTRPCDASAAWGITANPCVPGVPTITLSVLDAEYPTFTTGGIPRRIDGGVAVTNFANLSSVTVSLQGSFDTANDFIEFVNDGSTMGNIAATYTAATGVLFMSSSGNTATNAQWQSALRAVSFRNRQAALACTTRLVRFSASNPGGTASADVRLFLTVREFNAADYGTVLLWADPNQGVAASPVNSWTAVTGGTLTSANGPARVLSAYNGRAVLRFSGADTQYLSHTAFANVRDVFLVSVWSGGASYGPFRALLGASPGAVDACGYASSYDFHGSTGTKLFVSTTCQLTVAGDVVRLGGATSTFATADKPTSFMPVNVKTSVNTRLSRIASDRGISNRAWIGDYGDILYYSTPVSASDTAIIESYLAGKYWHSALWSTPAGGPANTIMVTANPAVPPSTIDAISGSPSLLLYTQMPVDYTAHVCNAHP